VRVSRVGGEGGGVVVVSCEPSLVGFVVGSCEHLLMYVAGN
jgi:hypothetical protein